MSETTELIAQQLLNGNINKRNWGDILFNVKVYGAKGDGSSTDTTWIQKTIDAAAVGGGIVAFSPGTYVTGSFTVPSNVTLFFANGAKLSINTGNIVTINGPIDAGFHQIFSGAGTVTGFGKVKELYPQWWGAVGNGSTDDYAALQATITATPKGGKVFLPRANYKSTQGLVINQEITITSPGYSPNALTGLFFDIDARPSGEPAIQINSSIDHLELSNFYLLNIGASARTAGCVHDGIYFKGVSGSTPINMIWNTLVENVTVDGFRHGFRGENLILPKFENCRSVTNGNVGFYFNTFSTGLSFINCYAERNIGVGFQIDSAAYPTLINCSSDSNSIGFYFRTCDGVNAFGLASEACTKMAVRSEASTTNIEGLTTVDSGIGTETAFVPTMVYVVSGLCRISGLKSIREYSPSIRTYSVLGEAGSIIRINAHAEGLPYFLDYTGKSSVNGQLQSSGLPTATGWTAQDVGQIVYNISAVEAGTTPNKYIIYGWRRMTTGNGNVLNTDWLPLRALTGN